MRLDEAASAAARRSNRIAEGEGSDYSTYQYWTPTLGELQANIDAGMAQLAAATDAPVSVSSADPYQMVAAPAGNTRERSSIRSQIGRQRGVLDRIVGAIHDYVAARYQELRFGSAVESAFEVVRADVDARIAELVPDALPKLSAAFENATSGNPEDWASAAATCRRLLQGAADALYPPGEPVDGRVMTDAAYINRLMCWIEAQSDSETAAEMITADLEYLGRRLDAVQGAGHKGAHSEVDRFDASRFVTGTYLLLGDILRLREPHGVVARQPDPDTPELQAIDTLSEPALPEAQAQ